MWKEVGSIKSFFDFYRPLLHQLGQNVPSTSHKGSLSKLRIEQKNLKDRQISIKLVTDFSDLEERIYNLGGSVQGIIMNISEPIHRFDYQLAERKLQNLRNEISKECASLTSLKEKLKSSSELIKILDKRIPLIEETIKNLDSQCLAEIQKIQHLISCCTFL